MQLTLLSSGGSDRSLRLPLSRCVAGAVAVLLLTVGAMPARAEPFVPADDSQVVEQLPTPATGTKRELRDLRNQLAKNPNDLALAIRLARRYAELARAGYDPRYNGQAEALLQPWWNLEAPPADVLVLRATLRQNRHEFDAALADLAAVLSAAPRNPQAWLTQAVILKVVGRHDEARRSCSRLASLATRLATAACMADLASVSGKAAEAYALLRAALDSTPDADASLRLWALTILAEAATRTGDWSAAERDFRAALALGLKDGYLLGAYADFLLDRQRPAEARDLLADETRVDPLLLRLTLAEAQLGAAELPEHIAALQARFAAARARGDTVHRREEARFTLHLLRRPDEALRLALANWQVQREVWDVRLVLETALAAGAPDEANDVIGWLKDTRLEDPEIATLVRRVTEAEQ